MEIIVQHDDITKSDFTVGVNCEGKPCPSCGVSMQLIIQEPCFPKDSLTTWWYCFSCRSTDRVKVDSSMIL